MECTCVRQTDLPGTSRLFADLVYHPDRIARFYSCPLNRELDSFRAEANRVDLPPERRAALVAALRETNGESELLEVLAQQGTVAVVTGQQTGLFSGPAYTLYKALTAVKLARTLSAEGVPSVPIFWIATEDHDFAEIDHACVFNSAFEPRKIQAGTSAEPGRPVGEIPLEEVPIEALREGLAGLPFSHEVADLIASHYRPGVTFGAAFSGLLKSWLGPYGILIVDPMSPAMRELAAPTMRRALDTAPELTRGLLERNRELEKAGYHAQVHVEESTSLFFLLESGRRLTMRRSNGEYVVGGRRIAREDLKARANELSPNALLRPVIQDSMLPTVAYVGGPAELAYLAQSQVIYDGILGRQPFALPRTSFTILDKHSHKLMQRYDLCLPDFFDGEDALREKIGGTLAPREVSALMAETRVGMSRSVEELKRELVRFDPTLAKALNRSGRKMEYQLEKMGRKVARQTMLRDLRATQDARALANLIFPHKHLQERLYSIAALVAQHGFGLIQEIYESVQLECPDHQLLTA